MGNPGQTKKIPIVRWFGLKHVHRFFTGTFSQNLVLKVHFGTMGGRKNPKLHILGDGKYSANEKIYLLCAGLV